MMLLLVGGHSRGDLQACAVRAQGGQLKLYDHDHLTKVTQIIHHPRFNASLSVEEGVDVALMRLETPVMPSHHVGMVSLPPASLRVPERQMCWVTGWGYIRLGGRFWGPTGMQLESHLGPGRGRELGRHLWSSRLPRGVRPSDELRVLDPPAEDTGGEVCPLELNWKYLARRSAPGCQLSSPNLPSL
ncbi:tryptase-like isoform X3 [Vicugna pacos]|uniref:Tryptase-like isoform X3 n=1 Tax=Vicugna pacos TaxID=30538 RepID=A0ABM5BPX4_VICPA